MKDEADFMEEVGKLTAYAQQYVKDQVAYGKLEIAERSSLAISWIVLPLSISSRIMPMPLPMT